MNAPQHIDAATPIRLTVENLEVLDRAGALAGYRRTELIDGVIVEMSPMGLRHARVNGDLYMRLRFALEDIASPLTVLAGGPTVAIPPHDAPQPDIVLLGNAKAPGYAELDDVKLVMEVSDATLRRDLTIKRKLYAEAGISEYWVIDVEGVRVHQFWSPSNGAYRDTRVITLNGELRSATIPDLAIDGSGIL